jgi:uncharacterized protein involved in outer membrane biogenesis
MTGNSRRFRKLELSLAFVLMLMVGISFIPLEDDFYRQKLIDMVAESTDYRIEIDGSFKVYLSLTPGFEATEVTIREQGATDSYKIRQLAVNVSLFSLWSDQPIVSYMSIAGVEIDLAVIAAAEKSINEDKHNIQSEDISIPSIKKIELRDVSLKYGNDVSLQLAQWTIEESWVSDAMQVSGEGQLNSHDYQINGSLGSLAELLGPDKPYTLDLGLHYQGIGVSLAGSIANPLEVGELQLQLEIEASDLSATLVNYGLAPPPAGTLKVTGSLIGNLKRPSLENLNVTLSKGQALSIKASGSIANLLAMENDVIQFNGSTNDPKLLAWVLPDDLTGTEEWRAKGKLITHKTGFRLDDLDLEGTDPRGLTLKLNGGGLLENFTAEQPFSKLDLNVEFNSTNTIAARPLLIEVLPEMGAVKGQLRITALSDKDMAFENIDVTAGVGADVKLIAKGRMARVPMDPDTPNTGIDLQLDLAASNSNKLGKLFEIDLPAVEPVRVKGRFTGSRLDSKIQKISLQAGNTDKLTLNAQGDIKFDDFSKEEYLKNINLKVDFKTPTTKAVANFIDQDLPEAGPASGSFTLQGNLKKLQARDIDLKVGKSNELQLGAKGEVRKIQLEPKLIPADVRLKLVANSPSTDKLSPLLDFDVPNLGALQAHAQLVDQDGSLGLESAEIKVGATDKPTIKATGEIDDIFNYKEIAWQIHIDIGTDETLSSLLGRPLPDLGKLHGDVELSDTDGSLGIDKLEIASEEKDLLNIKVNGLFDNFKEADNLDMQAEISVHSLEIIGLLLGQDWPDSKPIQVTGKIKADKKEGAFEGKLIIGNTEILADVSGSLGEPRPILKGKVETKTIYLVDFGFPETEPEQTDADTQVLTQKDKKQSANRDRLFSTEPLSLDWLQKFDLDLHITADDVVGTGAKLRSFVIPLQITDGGKLLMAPAALIYDEGAVLVDLVIDSKATPPRAGFKITADDVSVGTSLAHVGAQVPVDGSLNINVDLSSQGQSAAEMAGNLNGVIELGMENIKMPRRTAELLTVDLFGWALSSTFGRARQTKLDCGIAKLKVDKGQLVSEIFFLDGPNLTLSGEGSVNLGSETLDLSFFPKKKSRLFSSVTPINITGSITKPSVKVISSSAAATTYAGLSMAPQIYIPVTALGYLGELFSRDESKGEDSACLEYTQKKD